MSHYGKLPDDPREVTLGQLVAFLRVNPHLNRDDLVNQLFQAVYALNKEEERDEFAIFDLTL